jgi:DNA-binding HxlR family transcriptional regulator
LLGRRWALRVLWELGEPAGTFRDLQQRCDGVSSSVLASRLSELREARLVNERYELTTTGRRLRQALEPVADWATDWHRRRPRAKPR